MGTFVISKRINGDYKFIFASRKGKTVFTSIACKQKSDCEQLISRIQENTDWFSFTRIKASGGKLFFRISKDGLVLASSRKYTTDRLLQKGIDELLRSIANAEILDFSELEPIFPTEATNLEIQIAS